MKVISRYKPRYPIAIEREYARLLAGHVKDISSIADDYKNEMEGLIANGNANTLNVLMDRIQARINRIEINRAAVSAMGEKVSRWTATQLDKVFQSVFGASPSVSISNLSARANMDDVDDIEQLLELWTDDNISLIRSIDTDALNRIRRQLADAIASTHRGEGVEGTLNKWLAKAMDITKGRAALIARDQIGKLNGSLSTFRHRHAGIGSYIWRTAHDARVRPSHADLDGKEFSYDNPPSIGNPGTPIQCRCIADPVIDLSKYGVKPKKGGYYGISSSQNPIASGKIKAEPVETIAGIKRGVPMTIEKADFEHANPRYCLGEEYQKNCQTCVVAYEARRRGFDVIAKGHDGSSIFESLAYNPRIAWISPKTGMLSVK